MMPTTKRKNVTKKTNKTKTPKAKKVAENIIQIGEKLFVKPDVVPNYIADDALQVVNAYRKAAKKKLVSVLPPGIPEDDCNCPIFNALKDCDVLSVTENGIQFKKTSPLYPISELLNETDDNPIGEFVREFDLYGSEEISEYQELLESAD